MLGGWHLALVTSTGLASLGHHVDLLPETNEQFQGLTRGELPIDEPNLEEWFSHFFETGLLKIIPQDARFDKSYDFVWLAVDTPVDDRDNADSNYVINFAQSVLESLPCEGIFICSSQLPVGSVETLSARLFDRTGSSYRFAAIPENLRLGSAMKTFLEPDRIIVGVDEPSILESLVPFLNTISSNLEIMSIRSAEMVKHALNAFLATSVTFANEVGVICDQVGADAQQVARGLMTDLRIGPKAYLRPGEAFAGGTLARDLRYLSNIDSRSEVGRVPLFEAIRVTNELHKDWSLKVLDDELQGIQGKKVLIAGLTYKADTNTLRRSAAIELCEKLLDRGAQVTIAERSNVDIPEDISSKVSQVSLEGQSTIEFDAVVVGVVSPEVRSFLGRAIRVCAPNVLVVDPGSSIKQSEMSLECRYRSVGSKLF